MEKIKKTTMRNFLFLLVFIAKTPIFAQNLVQNPSFEQTTGNVTACSFDGRGDLLTYSCKKWNGFFQQTPDYHFYDANVLNCPIPKPRTGKYAVGLICFFPRFDDYYHEHLQGSLTKPLEKGKIYVFEFWISQADSAGRAHIKRQIKPNEYVKSVACNRLGAYFSVEPNSKMEDFQESIVNFDLRPQIIVTEILTTKPGEWRKISLEFKADKPYKYFTFGNFFSDSVNETTPSASGEIIKARSFGVGEKIDRPLAYYLFDDFFMAEKTADLVETLQNGGVYTFKNVLFEVGKSDLLPASFVELDRLADYLAKNPALRVEISGHTDDNGNDAENLILSQNRAKSAVFYLISKNLDEKRLSSNGFGESKPVVPNISEAARAQNRRVECRVIL
jgi:outer membrane protein OmpA-like peptidoglycan-associated protein